MKKIFSCLLLAMLSGILVLGCGDKQAPISPTQDSTSKLFKSSGSGAQIIRYQYSGYWTFVDNDAGLRLILGVNPLDVCNGTDTYDLYDVKDVFLPNKDPNLWPRIIDQVKGDNVTASVWPFTALDCGLFTTTSPIAGNVDFIYTDNDIFSYMRNNKNANAFSFKAHGTLTGGDGQEYRLNLVYRVVWDGVDGSKIWNEDLKFQLTQIGGK
ncbi:MAG TPA: hypothetical protein VGD14_20055 [bacterium]